MTRRDNLRGGDFKVAAMIVDDPGLDSPRRPGRPSLPPSERRTKRMEVRLTEDEHAAVLTLGNSAPEIARKAWARAVRNRAAVDSRGKARKGGE